MLEGAPFLREVLFHLEDKGFHDQTAKILSLVDTKWPSVSVFSAKNRNHSVCHAHRNPTLPWRLESLKSQANRFLARLAHGLAFGAAMSRIINEKNGTSKNGPGSAV